MLCRVHSVRVTERHTMHVRLYHDYGKLSGRLGYGLTTFLIHIEVVDTHIQ